MKKRGNTAPVPSQPAEPAADSYIKLCGFSLWCGVSGLVLLIVAVLVAFRFESIGLVTTTRYLVLPVSLGAILLGAIASGRTSAPNPKARKRALAGLVLGLIVAGIVILIMMAALVFFLPLLLVGSTNSEAEVGYD